jgi:D-alanine transaminase
MGGGFVMKDSVWINGRIVPRQEAYLDIEDRGYQFADGVYEVVRIYDNKPFTLDEHLQRLERSAGGIKLQIPLARKELAAEMKNFITGTRLRDAYLYLQLTRGVAPRNHKFPAQSQPNLLFYTVPLPAAPVAGEGEGIKLHPVADERWKRCWIKCIGLTANVLAKNEALDAGCDEAVFVDGDIVNECSTSNLFAVINNTLVTHPIGSKVLPGISRLVVFDCAQELGIPIEERPLTEEEARSADELFITSTTREIAWVSSWGQSQIAQGCCGPITLKLHRAFRDRVQLETAPARAPARTATRANRPAQDRSAA